VKYKVIGECEVAGVEPGGIVTTQQLEEHRALIAPLLGTHLEEASDEPEKSAAKSLKAEAGKP
jgi:hypothetical protein